MSVKQVMEIPSWPLERGGASTEDERFRAARYTSMEECSCDSQVEIDGSVGRLDASLLSFAAGMSGRVGKAGIVTLLGGENDVLGYMSTRFCAVSTETRHTAHRSQHTHDTRAHATYSAASRGQPYAHAS